MKEIKIGDEIYAIKADGALKAGSEWFGQPFEPLQVQRMNYPAGKEFKSHRHIMNPRIIKLTQEAFIVIKGRLAVDISDENKVFIGTLEAGPGEAIFVYKGYHGVRVLEDVICYETKAGQYSYTSEDKEFMNV